VRIVIMESDGGLKNMSKMLKELTLDESKPTLAILGSKEGGGKLMVATTENSIASERYNSVEILQSIIPHISGGGGGRPTFAQGGGSKPEGLQDSFDAAKSLLDI
ncbi:MAG: DHHA1 domain-containing protein, partial [Candidatus Thermoplasmatota archaeon]|nr:DHHA1 domain-containing protein [Candidatus Thermoplasmatota archaeon]